MCLVWHVQIQGFLLSLWGVLRSVIGPFWEALTSKGEGCCASQLSGAIWEVTLLFSAHAPLLTMLKKDSSAFCDKDLLVHLSKLENNLISSSSLGKYFPFWLSRKYLFITARQLQDRLIRYLFFFFNVFIFPFSRCLPTALIYLVW